MNSTSRNCVFFILLLAVGVILIFIRYDQLRKEHLNFNMLSQRSAIDSTISTYRLLSDTIFSEIINTDEILQQVSSIINSSDDLRDFHRGMLYRKLAPLYDRLREKNVRQLHFHAPNGTSILRFHAPKRSGDSLSDVRPSVEIANTELREVHGYESGRVFHGFRHIYPLIFNGNHIGSVEVSSSFFHIQNKLQQLEQTNQTTLEFMLYKPDCWHKLFTDLRAFHPPSILHPDYVKESAGLISYQCMDKTEDSHLSAEIKEKLSQNNDLRKKLELKQNCSFSLTYNYATYSVIFHSVKNIVGKHAAYIVAITPDPFIAGIRSNALQLFSVYSLLLTALFIFKLRMITLNAKQQQHTSFLQNISDNMGIGMYVTNNKGIITFANTAATKLLGYDKKDLVGQHAHRLFHLPLTPDSNTCICKEVLSDGINFHSEDIVFWSRNAGGFPVEAVCSPLYDKKKIVGVTTVFQDISERLLQKQKLKDTQEKLQKLALLDGLTAIPNRRNFDIRAQEAWRSALRHRQALGVLIIDIDHFKLYNDHYGHLQGDKSLIRVATLLKQACKRPGDFVARYGGEEFVALLPDTNTHDCYQVGKRMLSMI